MKIKYVIFLGMGKETRNKNFVVTEIPTKVANSIVKKFHYSKKVVPNSSLHLGVFTHAGVLVGALQFGPPMNPNSTPENIASGSTSEEMYELNRMVMDDDQPKNSESQAISLCINWVKKYRTSIHYLLSHSDGKEGNVGYIYQATNWKYLGYRISDSFYKLDNKIFHSVQVWHLYKENHVDRDIKTTHEILFDNFKNVSKLTSKQFIYVFSLTNKYTFNGLDQYPKKDNEHKILSEVFYKKENEVLTPTIEIDYVKLYSHTIFENQIVIYASINFVNNVNQCYPSVHNGKRFIEYTKENCEVLNNFGFAVNLPK